MASAEYEVLGYSVAVLETLLKDCSHQKALTPRTKPHMAYLEDYLRDIGARTIVVERPYTDRDYLAVR